MSTTRVGVNGFGRVGRLALRAGWGASDVEFVHVNEPKGDAANAAHLLTFGSVHGRWARDVRGDGDALAIDGTAVSYSDASEPGAAAWADNGVDVVLECSG